LSPKKGCHQGRPFHFRIAKSRTYQKASGKPQQNAYIERYNRTVRGEWLGQYIFETIEEAQDQATKWLWTYNNERPNMGIGGMTPAMKLRAAA
jgi:putative transposase